MPRTHKPDAAEGLVEAILVETAIEELGRSTDDEVRALRRALLVLALISDHDGQREAVRTFRSFLLAGFEPLRRGFVDGKHELVGGLETVAGRSHRGVSLLLNVRAVKELVEASLSSIASHTKQARRPPRSRARRHSADVATGEDRARFHRDHRAQRARRWRSARTAARTTRRVIASGARACSSPAPGSCPPVRATWCAAGGGGSSPAGRPRRSR